MKKIVSFLVFLLLFIRLSAQHLSLPVVNAKGGEGKNKLYKKPSKEELENSPDGFIWGLCSSCLGTMDDCNIRASSTLAPQGSVNYSPEKLQDDDPTTAWVEGDVEYGIGEYIEIKNSRLYGSLFFYNGYQKSPKAFIDNSRVKALRVSENGIDRCVIRLKDEMGAQYLSTEDLGLTFDRNNDQEITIRFTIMEVYPGSKFKDVALSELFMSGCCVSGESNLDLENGGTKPMADLKFGDRVKLLDRNNNIIYASIVELGSVVHDDILKVTTEKGSHIQLTSGHYLFVGNCHEKIQARQLTEMDSLITAGGDRGISYEKISNITRLNQPVKTYYFKKLDFGDQPINWPLRVLFNHVVTTDEYLEKLNRLNGF